MNDTWEAMMAKIIRGGEDFSRQFDESVRRQHGAAITKSEEEAARKKQLQYESGRAMRRLGAIIRGQPPSRDPNWDPQ